MPSKCFYLQKSKNQQWNNRIKKNKYHQGNEKKQQDFQFMKFLMHTHTQKSSEYCTITTNRNIHTIIISNEIQKQHFAYIKCICVIFTWIVAQFFSQNKANNFYYYDSFCMLLTLSSFWPQNWIEWWFLTRKYHTYISITLTNVDTTIKLFHCLYSPWVLLHEVTKRYVLFSSFFLIIS